MWKSTSLYGWEYFGYVRGLGFESYVYKIRLKSIHSLGRKLSQMVETQECFYFKMFNPFTCLGAPLIQNSLGTSKQIKDT